MAHGPYGHIAKTPIFYAYFFFEKYEILFYRDFKMCFFDPLFWCFFDPITVNSDYGEYFKIKIKIESIEQFIIFNSFIEFPTPTKYLYHKSLFPG